MDDILKSNVTMNCPFRGTCIPYETVIENVRLAMAYIPYQKMCTLLSPIEALEKGTIFPELYSPWEKKKHSQCGCK